MENRDLSLPTNKSPVDDLPIKHVTVGHTDNVAFLLGVLQGNSEMFLKETEKMVSLV